MYIESEFEDNAYTIQGTQLHERVDQAESMLEKGSRVERALPIWSDNIGLIGKADLVEFRADSTVVPIEYKRGIKRNQKPDDLQLCAQAICLMEMLSISIEFGYIFYFQSNRRREVKITKTLISEVEEVIGSMRKIHDKNIIPEPSNDSRCPDCSLIKICQPNLIPNSKKLLYDKLFKERQD